MSTTDLNTPSLSEEFVKQMSAAIQDVVVMEQIRKMDEKLDNMIQELKQIKMSNKDEIMNKKEACAYAKVSNNNLDKWILKGLKITKVDRTIRIKKSDIDYFMDNNAYL